MYKNIILAVGITILFMGVSINPAIAVNPISSDNEDDCEICPKVGKTNLVRLKSLIDKVETLNNDISLISRLNPEVVEKYQELSDRITIFTEMNKKLKPDTSWEDHPIICNILAILMLPFVFIEEITILIEYRINPDSAPLLWYLLLPFIIIGEFGITFFCLLAVAIGCVDIHVP